MVPLVLWGRRSKEKMQQGHLWQPVAFVLHLSPQKGSPQFTGASSLKPLSYTILPNGGPALKLIIIEHKTFKRTMIFFLGKSCNYTCFGELSSDKSSVMGTHSGRVHSISSLSYSVYVNDVSSYLLSIFVEFIYSLSDPCQVLFTVRS